MGKGRFVQRDPIDDNVPFRHYLYVRNHPFALIDPTGRNDKDVDAGLAFLDRRYNKESVGAANWDSISLHVDSDQDETATTHILKVQKDVNGKLVDDWVTNGMYYRESAVRTLGRLLARGNLMGSDKAQYEDLLGNLDQSWFHELAHRRDGHPHLIYSTHPNLFGDPGSGWDYISLEVLTDVRSVQFIAESQFDGHSKGNAFDAAVYHIKTMLDMLDRDNSPVATKDLQSKFNTVGWQLYDYMVGPSKYPVRVLNSVLGSSPAARVDIPTPTAWMTAAQSAYTRYAYTPVGDSKTTLSTEWTKLMNKYMK